MPKLVHKYAFLMRILFSKNAQDPTRDLLDPLVEFVRWCLYFEIRGTEQNCLI